MRPVFPQGMKYGHGEESSSVENNPGDSEAERDVGGPGEEGAGDYAIGIALLQDLLDGLLDEIHGLEKIEAHLRSGGGGEIFAAVGKAGLAAGEIDERDVDIGAVLSIPLDCFGEERCV